MEQIEHSTNPQLTTPLLQVITGFTEAISEPVVTLVSQLMPDIEKQCEKTNRGLAVIKKELKQLRGTTQLLETINETNRKLSDQFYDERIIAPMSRSLFPLTDFMLRARESLQENVPRYKLALQYFDAIQSQLDQFLVNFGIESYYHESKETFIPHLMKPLKFIFTKDKDLNGLVAESLLCGFKTQERILRLETVSLFKYQDTSIQERSTK